MLKGRCLNPRQPASHKLVLDVTPWRACILLLRLQWRRSTNRFRSRLASGRRRKQRGKKKPSDSRAAVGRKAEAGWALPILIGLAATFQGFYFSHRIVQRASLRYGPEILTGAMATLLLLLLITLVLIGLGLANRDLSRPEWDMDWLLTLPASMSTLHWMKLIQGSLLNFYAWFSLFPFVTLLLWHTEWGYWAPLVALVLVLPMLFVVGMIRLLVENAARLFFPAVLMRNLQAMATVFALLGLFCVMSPALEIGARDYFLWHWLAASAQWIRWNPLGACATAALAPTRIQAVAPLLIYFLQVGALMGLGYWAVSALGRRGAVWGRGQLQGRRRVASSTATSRRGGFGPGGVFGKQLKLIVRDRTFFVQAFVVPAVVVVMQVGLGGNLLAKAMSDPRHLAALAFGLAGYLLLGSSTTVITAEGGALWILFTLPKRLERILFEKALLWSAFGIAFACSALIYGGYRIGYTPAFFGLGAYVLVGVPIYALIGAALGVAGSNPLADEPSRRLRADYLRLFLMLEGFYVYGCYADGVWARLSVVVLAASLTLALWQKIGQQIPFILDPVTSPPSRLSLSDGLLAVMLFFVLQVVFRLLTTRWLSLSLWSSIVVAFALAGAATVMISLFTLWRAKVPDLFRSLGFGRGTSWLHTVGSGLIWSLPAVGAALAFVYLTPRIPFLADLKQGASGATPFTTPEGVGWFAGLAVVAAPIFEEIIFRGMIFRGLRSAYGLRLSACASAGIFAVVHPPLAVMPVFAVGILCAMALERSRSLLAPMMVHASYNLAIVALATCLR